MKYKIKSSLLPAEKSYITGKPIEKPVQQMLAMYERNEDLTNSPFIQAKQWMHHVYCHGKGNTIESAYERQQQIIDLYESLKKGYNGSTIYIWFDDDGFIHLGDGFHRIAILHYLNQDVLLNCETDWVDRYDGQRHTDFPLVDVLLKEAPQGEWTYQPINDPRLKGWKVDRFDAAQRLEYILKNLKGKKVLDIGCSEGYYSRELARRGYEVTAIDRRKGLIAAARYLTTLEGLKVDYHVVNDWAEFDGKYDTILFLAIIHNDMKTIGVEKGLEKLRHLRDRANVIFMEVPNNHNERGWGKDGYPKFDFHSPDSVKAIESNMAMKVVDKFNGRRVIYTLNGKTPMVDMKLNGLVRGSDRERLVKLASEVKDGVILEIGALTGASTCAMAEVASVPVYSIDLWNLTSKHEFRNDPLNNPYFSLDTFNQNIKERGLEGKVTPIRGESNMIARAWTFPIGLLFIDALHTYDGVMGDYSFAKYVIPGGRIAFHDYDKTHPGVMKAIDEIRKSNEWVNWELPEEGDPIYSSLISATKLDPKLIFEPDVNGYPMYLFKDEKWITPCLVKHHLAEEMFTQFVKDNLRKGQTFVDIGAHIGYYTVLASKIVGAKGKVIAFEPSTENLSLLRKNVELNKCNNVTVFPFALSDKSGKSKLYTMESTSHGQRYLADSLSDKPTGEGFSLQKILTRNDYEEVKTIRLDEILTKPPDITKIDVEGAECLVITGGEKVLGNTILIEDFAGDAVKQLIDLGYAQECKERNNYILKSQPIIRPSMSLKTDHYRFHLLGLPHTITRKEETMCAFTQLVFRLSKMLTDLGHEVYHYGTEGSELSCTEHIDVLTQATQRQSFTEKGFPDWTSRKQLWVHNGSDLAYKTFRKNAIEEIKKRIQSRDMILISNGAWLAEVGNAFPSNQVIEPIVGYLGFYSKYKVFPSYAWMHHMMGRRCEQRAVSAKTKAENFATGAWYDAVIPHFFDPNDFTFQEKKGDHYVYIGRLIKRKGVHVVADITKRLGAKLIVAGQPLYPDNLQCLKDLGLLQPHIEYVGTVDLEGRNELLKNARAVITPSLYFEPFGLVIVESLLCGTPVITTDWGSFPEIVPQGEVGYRCRTMDDFLWAAMNIDNIDPKHCREYAVNNFSMDRIAKSYQEYFTKVQDLYEGGWYKEHPERKDLDWLRRY